MSFLSKARKLNKVDCSEFGISDPVFVRSLSMLEVKHVREALSDSWEQTKALLVLAVVDADGTSITSAEEVDSLPLVLVNHLADQAIAFGGGSEKKVAAEFWQFELALAAGYSHPDYWLDDLTPAQFYDLQEYACQRGLPHSRHDNNLALIAYILYQTNRNTNTTDDIEFGELLPYAYEKPEQTPEEGLAIIRRAKGEANHK